MLSKSVSILLLVALLSPTLLKGYLLADYAINQEYIAQYLCINKDSPRKQCDGKCYLSTLLKEAEKSEPEDELPGRLINLTETVVFLCTQQIGIPFEMPPITDQEGWFLKSLCPPLLIHQIFRPPEAGSLSELFT